MINIFRLFDIYKILKFDNKNLVNLLKKNYYK